MPQKDSGSALSSYTLGDSLARSCLGRTHYDVSQSLSWANSICLLFILIATIGLRAPKIIQRPMQAPDEPLVLVWETPPDPFTPNLTPADMETDLSGPERDPPPPFVVSPIEKSGKLRGADLLDLAGTPLGSNELVPILPAPIPRTGPAGEPEEVQGEPRERGGNYPTPPYAISFQQQGMHGGVVVQIDVDTAGLPASVRLRSSSGYPELDRSTVEWVKQRWRWPVGKNRRYVWTCEYRLR